MLPISDSLDHDLSISAWRSPVQGKFLPRRHLAGEKGGWRVPRAIGFDYVGFRVGLKIAGAVSDLGLTHISLSNECVITTREKVVRRYTRTFHQTRSC